ncbi:MAG: GspE/PulE family protein, partial [Pseudomonadota bacterium]
KEAKKRRRSNALARLVDKELLSSADEAHVTQICEDTGDSADQVLATLGLVAETDIAAALAEEHNAPIGQDLPAPDTDAFAHRVNVEFLRRHRLLPLCENDTSINVAIVDPGDDAGPRGLEMALQKPLQLNVITASRFESLFARSFGAIEQAGPKDDTAQMDVTADAERLRDMASEEPIIRLVNRLVAEAAEARASDIHIEPRARDAVMRIRVDGELRDHETLPTTNALAAVSRIKILAELDIAERRRPQDGRLNFPLHGRAIDIRVSTVPTTHGESVVLRLLDKETVRFDYDALGLAPDIVTTIEKSLQQPNGIFLVTGPTGSGKTTTLYTALSKLADGKRKILTIEDPIEYRIEGVSQSQANASIGLTFAAALRSFLRHDPDIMMVGEIRDLETAEIAIQAALTGHLVLSTLHTNDAPSAIVRLLDMGVDDFLLASTLNGVLAQRLVRTLCDRCKAPTADDADKGAFQATGCEACGGSGFKGRRAIGEIIEISNASRRQICAGVNADALAETCRADGYKTLFENGVAMAAAGVTTLEEVRRASKAHG